MTFIQYFDKVQVNLFFISKHDEMKILIEV